MIKPVSKTTLYEEVIKQIISMIKEGKWIPGDKIPGELSLSESFNVSRNIIREALKSLELSGIVEAKPGKTTCAECSAEFEIDDRVECVFVNTEKLRLPAKGIVCPFCGLIQNDDDKTCLYCGMWINSNVQ